MIRGVDSNVLVYLASADSPKHTKTRHVIDDLLRKDSSSRLAVTADVLLEFVHVVTDARRLRHPLDMTTALDWAEQFWSSTDVMPLVPSAETFTRTMELLRQHRLSRKRLRDTALASILEENGIRELLTANTSDFKVFPFLTAVDPTV